MAWNLQGTFYENCSCDAICPCTWSNLGHRATRDDYCRFAMAFEVASGDVEGVDVSGTSFVLIGDTPPDMSRSNLEGHGDPAIVVASRPMTKV